jgi:hypothetical protein
MPNYSPADMAYMLRASENARQQGIDPNSVVRPNEFMPNFDPNSVVRSGEMPQMPPNFVPPTMNGFPKLRQGDKEILENFGITPEELFNIQAQLRKDNATR